MRVLWIANDCSLQVVKNNPCLTARYEYAFAEYAVNVKLAVAYAADGVHADRIVRNGITYYAVHSGMTIGISDEQWELTKAELLQIIDDFKPNVIQCYGAEWPYGRIAEVTSIPVVIHMMGFLNIYFLALKMVTGGRFYTIRGMMKSRAQKLLMHLPLGKEKHMSSAEYQAESERKVMATNRYFFGRTDWDQNIVKYYSPKAEYFRVAELLKPNIYRAAGTWSYHYNGKLRLFTASSGDDRKGNEIILLTAKILKNLLKVEFEWRIAGSKDFIPRFERWAGINCEDVNIRLMGIVDDLVIADELKKADFFIHPSIVDNSPHAVCEAQLIGCPVIVSNVGGLPQLVSHGETGWLYPYTEPHTLSFLICNLCEEKALVEMVSAREKKIALERHDPKSITGDMIKAYERILQY